jgi:hypothetical protein
MYELKPERLCKLMMALKLGHLIQHPSNAVLQQALGEQKRNSEQILAES